MKKSKDQRYKEAIERNIKNMELDLTKYINKSLIEVKQILGIKKEDKSFNQMLIDKIMNLTPRYKQCNSCLNKKCICHRCRGMNEEMLCYWNCIFDENEECKWKLNEKLPEINRFGNMFNLIKGGIK